MESADTARALADCTPGQEKNVAARAVQFQFYGPDKSVEAEIRSALSRTGISLSSRDNNPENLNGLFCFTQINDELFRALYHFRIPSGCRVIVLADGEQGEWSGSRRIGRAGRQTLCRFSRVLRNGENVRTQEKAGITTFLMPRMRWCFLCARIALTLDCNRPCRPFLTWIDRWFRATAPPGGPTDRH